MIYLSDLLAATGGQIYGQAKVTEFKTFAYDSRRLRPGQLFIAVQTPKGDGHDYIEEAIAAGASGVLCQYPGQYSGVYPVTTILVPNTQEALLAYAQFILQKYQPQVIGVTGSIGKTTAKEAIAAVLSTKFEVFKNYGSYNGRYGLPIALGRLEEDHQIAVLEMACDGFGEITEIARLTEPRAGIVTAVAQAHLAALGSLDNIALEKGQLIAHLPASGVAILNGDDPRVLRMKDLTQAEIITYGFNENTDVQVKDVIVTPDGTHFTVAYQDEIHHSVVPLLGSHQLYPILAAVATGLAYEIPIAPALKALSSLPRLPGRLHPLSGYNQSLLLDDTFNASPEAVKAAIRTLASLEGTPKIAVLGALAELGQAEAEILADLGAYLADKVDYLVTLDEVGQEIGQAAVQSGLPIEALTVAYTPTDAAEAVKARLSPGAIVLLKGSAEARVERVTAAILADPADRRKLARSAAGWERVRLGVPDRPTWIELDLDALRGNVRCLADLARPARLMAVLKADGYGHGAVKVARTALSNGASWLGVATVSEAISLRQAGIEAPILVLGYVPAWQASEAIRHQIRATVFTEQVAQAFSQAARRLNSQARVHIKVDTGMGRLGLLPEDVLGFVQAIQLPGLLIEGLFTHFARADEADLDPSQAQLARFKVVLADLEKAGFRPPLVHAANTAATLNMPEARFDLVRIGIGLYGLNPAPETPLPEGIRPVLSFKTTIAQVKTLPPDSPIGYGGTYRTQGNETIAIIPVGYADGFRRAPQTWGEVLVKGQRAPLVGRVSMDQSAILVSHIPDVRQGDEVVLIGQQGPAMITADEAAARLGTINYEVVSGILARVPRMH